MESKNNPEMARQIADAVKAFELHADRRQIESVTVVLSRRTLVITLDGALTSVEESLAQDAAGAAQVEAFHKELYFRPPMVLWREIERITGSPVEKIAGEDRDACTCVKVFPTGTVVHVYLLAQPVPTSVWSDSWGEPRPSLAFHGRSGEVEGR